MSAYLTGKELERLWSESGMSVRAFSKAAKEQFGEDREGLSRSQIHRIVKRNKRVPEDVARWALRSLKPRAGREDEFAALVEALESRLNKRGRRSVREASGPGTVPPAPGAGVPLEASEPGTVPPLPGAGVPPEASEPGAVPLMPGVGVPLETSEPGAVPLMPGVGVPLEASEPGAVPPVPQAATSEPEAVQAAAPEPGAVQATPEAVQAAAPEPEAVQAAPEAVQAAAPEPEAVQAAVPQSGAVQVFASQPAQVSASQPGAQAAAPVVQERPRPKKRFVRSVCLAGFALCALLLVKHARGERRLEEFCGGVAQTNVALSQAITSCESRLNATIADMVLAGIQMPSAPLPNQYHCENDCNRDNQPNCMVDGKPLRGILGIRNGCWVVYANPHFHGVEPKNAKCPVGAYDPPLNGAREDLDKCFVPLVKENTPARSVMPSELRRQEEGKAQ